MTWDLIHQRLNLAEIWLNRNGDIYKSIAMYVDNLAFCWKDTQNIVDSLNDKYNFKLKGTELSFHHLNCDLFCNCDGVSINHMRLYDAGQPIPPLTIGVGILGSSVSTTCIYNPVFDFRKSIKHDTNLFALYKDEKLWDM